MFVEAKRLRVPQILPVSVAILDRAGRIVAVNEAWKDFGRRHGFCLPNFGVGANYLRHSDLIHFLGGW